jgi:putative transposase
MIRTHIIPCQLQREIADAFNRASGRIYTGVLVAHWRVVRKKHLWLSEKSGTRISDSLVDAALHAHTIDAAQQGFYKACATAKALKRIDPTAKYPHWTKKFRTTVWKNTAIKFKQGQLELSNGAHNPKIVIALPMELLQVLRFLEVRLVYDKKVRRYYWHVVVENGIQPKVAVGSHVVSVDLGEIHPAVVGDEHESTLILCRERRHEAQGHAKRLAKLSRSLSRKTKGSRRHQRLVRAKSRMKAKHKRVTADMEHKVSRAIVKVALERQAHTIAMGNIKDIADGVALGKKTNQKISGWNHGKIRKLVEYKAAAEGIAVVLVNEAYTSQTCPTCRSRHKPKGRVYRCSSCGFQAHRDTVGQVNILSVFRFGIAGKIPAPQTTKHRLPFDIRLQRRRPDTGHDLGRVAHGFRS